MIQTSRRNFLKAFTAATVGASVLIVLPSLPTASVIKCRPIISGLHIHTGEIVFLDELLAGRYAPAEVVVRGYFRDGKWEQCVTMDKLTGSNLV